MNPASVSIQERPQQRLMITDRLRLEVAVVDPGSVMPGESDDSRVGVSPGRTILVVDDDHEMRAYVARCLQRFGPTMVRVEEAEDGAAAVVKLRTGGIDLVITDLVMPRMDGFALCAYLAADPVLRSTPVLLVSGEPAVEEARRRIAPGAPVLVLLKPFSARTLREAIQRLWQ